MKNVNQKVAKAFDVMLEASKEQIIKNGNLIPAVIFVSESQGTGVLMLADLPIGGQRHKLFELMGKKLAEEVKDIVGFIMISEAWMAKTNDTKEDIQKGNYIPPSEHPNRVEVVMASAKDINGNQRMYMTSMERINDKIIFIESKEQKEMNKIGWVNSSAKSEAKFEMVLLDKLFVAYKFNKIQFN